jgi:signal transduction histidine kinase
MAFERSINQIFTNKLFKDCSSNIFNFNLSNRNFTEFKEGDIIFQAGDTSNFIYLVISGEVKVKFRNINRVITKSAQDFFGDIEITRNTNRTSSAVAMNDSTLYRIDKGTFNKLCTAENQIISNYQSIQEIELKENGDNRPRPDIPSVLKLDSSPIKLNIFNRVIKDEPTLDDSDIISDNNEKLLQPSTGLPDEKDDTSGIPDLDSVIDDIKPGSNQDDALKKELLGDTEDFENWNFSTVDGESEDIEERIQFEDPEQKLDKKEIEKILSEKYNKELNQLRLSLAQSYNSLFETISKILPGINVFETCEKIVSVFLNHFKANFSSLFIVDEKTSALEKLLPVSNKKLFVPFNEGLTGKAAANKRIIVVRNPVRDFRYKAAYDIPDGFKEGSVAYVPLNDAENKLIGVLQLGRTLKDFTKEQEEGLKILGHQAGIVLRHSVINEGLFRQEKISAFGSISKFLMQDIKSPILTIKHYSNLVSRIDVPEQIKKVFTMLSMQANSVVDLMQSTFDFSEGKSSIKLQKTGFNEQLNNILELLSEYTESKNVKLFKKIGDNVMVNIEPRKFYVVCFQIIKNACEAMPAGGKVFINSEIVNQNVVLNIRDEGIGISEEIKGDIFSAFFSSGKENASGLGLAISKYLIELMNGSITFESKADKGTIIKIMLPIAEE